MAAQNDLFAKGVPEDVIIAILDHCRKYPDNKYLFQSKNPERMWFMKKHFEGLNPVFCTTIETNRLYPKIMQDCPSPITRARWMFTLSDMFDTYVTIEPIMDFDLLSMVQTIELCKPKQVNIGADSGNNRLPEPSFDKVMRLVNELKEFTTIHTKHNLGRLGVMK